MIDDSPHLVSPHIGAYSAFCVTSPKKKQYLAIELSFSFQQKTPAKMVKQIAGSKVLLLGSGFGKDI